MRQSADNPWSKFQAACIVVAVFVLDQASKWWAVRALTESPCVGFASWARGVEHPVASQAVVVGDGFWRFRYVENKGSIFGMGAEQGHGARTAFFIVLAVLAVVALAYVYRAGRSHRTLRWSAPLIAGGALGNYFDRVRLGYVVDFVEWHLGEFFSWPVPDGRVEDQRGGVQVALGCFRRFQLRARLERTITPSPAPATSNRACGLPAHGSPRRRRHAGVMIPFEDAAAFPRA